MHASIKNAPVRAQQPCGRAAQGLARCSAVGALTSGSARCLPPFRPLGGTLRGRAHVPCMAFQQQPQQPQSHQAQQQQQQQPPLHAALRDPAAGGVVAGQGSALRVALSEPSYAVHVTYSAHGRPLEPCDRLWAHAGHSGWSNT